jgi:hypothetical protein
MMSAHIQITFPYRETCISISSGTRVEHETHKCPLYRPVEVPIYMPTDHRIFLSCRCCAQSRSFEVQSRIFRIVVGWRRGNSDWSVLRSQELYLYTNGSKDLDEFRIREKFRIARTVSLGPLDHATAHKVAVSSLNGT